MACDHGTVDPRHLSGTDPHDLLALGQDDVRLGLIQFRTEHIKN